MLYHSTPLVLESVSANQGFHVRFPGKMSFDQWQKTGNADERQFGHGDGAQISGIRVNGSDTNLCSGAGACQIILTYTTP